MLYLAFLGLCALALVAGIFHFACGAIGRARARGFWRTACDLLLWIALVPVALFAIHPYLGDNLVGLGDSYHYGLQVADFVTQARHGMMPILVGQSDYAFNGNIHTVRTAPYFTHLAGLLDFLTAQRLSFVTLQNLTVVTTSLFAAWATFAVSLQASGGQRIASWLLAAIYVLSPAIMGPLALNDMFATYMAAPWLVICWYGLAGILQRENDLLPQFLAAGALALTWYAHPPIAAWLSMAWAAVQAVKAIMAGGTRDQWARQLASSLLLVCLGAYAFASIGTISSGAFGQANLALFKFDWDSLRGVLHTEFTPFLTSPTSGGIQLGWTLWLLLLAAGGSFLWFRNPAGLLLAALVAVLLCFLIPLPVVSEALWRRLPEQLVVLTNWPSQRLCPLLSAGIIAASALALRKLKGRSAAAYRGCCILLLVGCTWSALEVAVIHQRPGAARLSPAGQEIQFSPENLQLTRYSYALFEEPPPYFTHGWTDPEFESRLLDANLDVAGDNARTTLEAAGPGDMKLIEEQATINLPGPAEYLVAFAFAKASAKGEISIQGAGIQRHYTLPRSGGEFAFGSESGCAKTILLRLTQTGIRPILIGTTVPGVSFRVVPVRRDLLPVQVMKLTPYTASVRLATPGFLETPQVYLKGYTATVNGAASAVRSSPNGLVMVPVPTGESQVVVTYPGPVLLRIGWLLSLACLAAYPWLLAKVARMTAEPTAESGHSLAWVREKNILAGLERFCRHRRRKVLRTAALTGLVLGLICLFQQLWFEYRSYGSLRLTVELTRRSISKPEPLVTLGETGAADCIYILYDGIHHVRLGLDHWAYGGPISDPVAITYGPPHVIEIDIGGLYPGSWWFSRKSKAPDGKSGVAPLVLKLDGQTVLSQENPFYSVDRHKVYIGRNPAGGSVTSSRFSGVIHSTERFMPSTPPAGER